MSSKNVFPKMSSRKTSNSAEKSEEGDKKKGFAAKAHGSAAHIAKPVTVPSLYFRSQLKKVVKKNNASMKNLVGEEGNTGLASSNFADDSVGSSQLAWEALSAWLQKTKLRELTMPSPIDVTSHGGCPDTPIFGQGKNSQIKRVLVKKRFSSRKMPHMIEFENADGEVKLFLFKQDDDITMDVVIMNLFKCANEIFRAKGVQAHMYTYEIVACRDKTGFGEIVPGDTMFNFHAQDLDKALGKNREAWERFSATVVGVCVTTALFDITDRHHNNVMFTPTGEVCLIDLSASLGYKAPMDAGLSINPVYLPNRFLALQEYFQYLRKTEWGEEGELWDKYFLEERCIKAYYALYNDRTLRTLMEDVDYKLLKPHVFLKFLHDRPKQNQYKEGLRNDLVKAMDENKSFSKFVAALTSIIPMN